MAKKRKLTAKQKEALNYIIECVEKDHRTPTFRQLGDRFNWSSTGSGRRVVEALVKKDEVVRDEALARGVRLNPKKYKVTVSRKKR